MYFSPILPHTSQSCYPLGFCLRLQRKRRASHAFSNRSWIFLGLLSTHLARNLGPPSELTQSARGSQILPVCSSFSQGSSCWRQPFPSAAAAAVFDSHLSSHPPTQRFPTADLPILCTWEDAAGLDSYPSPTTTKAEVFSTPRGGGLPGKNPGSLKSLKEAPVSLMNRSNPWPAHVSETLSSYLPRVGLHYPFSSAQHAHGSCRCNGLQHHSPPLHHFLPTM